jgi:hypothetical protein
MKTKLFALALAAVSAGLFAASPLQAMQAQPAVVKESPFACDTQALDPVARKRHFDVLGPKLVAKRLAVRELSNGYEFTWPSDAATYRDVAEWIAGEKACCPFFNFALNVGAEHGPLTLQVTGRPGTKAFMRSDAVDWVKPVLAQK